MAEALTELLKALNVPERKIKNTVKDKKLVAQLTDVLNEAGITAESKIDPELLDLYFEVAFKFPPDAPTNRSRVLKYLTDGKLGVVQVAETIKYFKKVRDAEYDVADFEKTCGVGVVVVPEAIAETIKALLEEHRIGSEELGPEPQKKAGLFWKWLKERLPFANPSVAKVELDKVLNPPKEDHTRSAFNEPVSGWAPHENIQPKKELLEEHLKVTGGRVVTRFPPEPNGYLHIGHAKAMHMDFGYAKAKEGYCIMRFDDTNPETESPEYVNSILENVRWMGHEYERVTYASDYFEQLYADAESLILNGFAYVDHQTAAEMERDRAAHKESPWRNRPKEESLKLFRDMRNGKFKEGEATLRLKMDMQSTNSVMWDLVAYRIKYIAHHRTGDAWCIYPSYDYTHALNDSYENVTHSLCSLEFAMRRESYHWLLTAANRYHPRVWEFARLNLSHTLLSKRKLIALVTGNHVKGWDDPRMPTIQGLRRKGYSAEGINSFCHDIGVTRNTSIIPIERLEESVRAHLNATSRRVFAVLEPLKLTVRGWKEGKGAAGPLEVTVANVPVKADNGAHTLVFTGSAFIEKSDFREIDEEGYYGLALNTKDGKKKHIKLKYVNLDVAVVDVRRNEKGEVEEIVVEASDDLKDSAKHAIHWIPVVEGEKALEVEVRDYDHLFLSEEPARLGSDWLNDLNPNSLAIRSALVEPSAKELKPFDRIQFERIGYYCVDPDSTAIKLVVNRTVSLKESAWKKQNKK